MDCNKDEATRAKELAERKLSAKDIVGAKKFALKAQSLYPNLEGLSQILAIIDVHVAAETRISGESDWYGILGVNPYSDDETVKKHFRKLALMLHPDKNKSVGAEGAFKLISEAWGLLSDRTKREAYNHRRLPRTTQPKAPPARSGRPPGTNGFHNFTNTTNSSTRPPKTSIHVGPTTASSHTRSSPNTFWTACNKCLVQFEYVRMYLNNMLRCSKCLNTFRAVEIAAPATSESWSAQQHHNSNTLPPDMNAYSSVRSTGSVSNVGPTVFTSKESVQTNFSTVAGAGSTTASVSAAQRAEVVQQAYEKLKREREKAAVRRQETVLRRRNPASKRVSNATELPTTGCNPDLKGNKPVKRSRLDDSGGTDHGGIMANQMGTENGGPGSKQSGFGTERTNTFSTGRKCNSVRDMSQLEIRGMLVEKARREIHKKLQEWSKNVSVKATNKEVEIKKENGKDKERVAINGEVYSENKCSLQMNTKKNSEIPAVDPDVEASEPTSISVPDSDFHDFDMDRSEKCFEDNHIWAAYDDDDGMPRYYAMIRSVISLNPFKIRIGWLSPKTNRELGPVTWVESGFSKTCGDFRVGKYEIYKILNSFSHKVKWRKGINGSVQIYPSKGDVWALYSNWSPDWNEHTPDEMIHKYDMVEVVDDYDEQGVPVTPLIKVVGFKTVFRRQADPQNVRRIPKEEMFRFSHQVPCHLLTGREAENAPQGCLELDPASTPLELLQENTETKKEDTMAVDEGKTASRQAVY